MTRKVASENHIGVSMEDYAPGGPLLGGDARPRPGDSDTVSTALVATTQIVGVAVLVLTICWVSLFLGGLLSAEYPDLIFNVRLPCCGSSLRLPPCLVCLLWQLP